MIGRVNPVFTSAWPAAWQDVEVVDGVLVAEPAGPGGDPAGDPWSTGLYDGSGRTAASGRVGRLVSVLA